MYDANFAIRKYILKDKVIKIFLNQKRSIEIIEEESMIIHHFFLGPSFLAMNLSTKPTKVYLKN